MSPLIVCLIICALTMASYVWGKIPMGVNGAYQHGSLYSYRMFGSQNSTDLLREC